MLSDVLGRSRATLTLSISFLPIVCWGVTPLASRPLIREDWEFFEPMSCWGLKIVIILHERGIPSKYVSSTHVEYVSGLCTHRPSLLPIEWFNE